MSLPADVSRCPGVCSRNIHPWPCHDCARRNDPPPDPLRVVYMAPPLDYSPERGHFCDLHIPMEITP